VRGNLRFPCEDGVRGNLRFPCEDYNNFINNNEFQKNMIIDITNIYDTNNTNTINYVEKYKAGY